MDDDFTKFLKDLDLVTFDENSENKESDEESFTDFLKGFHNSKQFEEMKEISIIAAETQMEEAADIMKLMRTSLLTKPLHIFALVQTKNDWSDEDLKTMKEYLGLIQIITDIINKVETEKLRKEGA